MARRYPALADGATYAAFLRKWEYLFAYAGAGFAKGYITCHMLTFVRAVRPLPRVACSDRLRVLIWLIRPAERRDRRVRLTTAAELGGLRGEWGGRTVVLDFGR